MINLPSKKSGVAIEGVVIDNFLIRIQTLDKDGAGGYVICQSQGTLASMAKNIAGWLEEARDIGYEQAKIDIYNAIRPKDGI